MFPLKAAVLAPRSVSDRRAFRWFRGAARQFDADGSGSLDQVWCPQGAALTALPCPATIRNADGQAAIPHPQAVDWSGCTIAACSGSSLSADGTRRSQDEVFKALSLLPGIEVTKEQSDTLFTTMDASIEQDGKVSPPTPSFPNNPQPAAERR